MIGSNYGDNDVRRVPTEDNEHPIGSGLGAAGGAGGGALAGAAIGAPAGPVGSIIGAVGGALVGGMAGAGIGYGLAELVNPQEVEDYYRTRDPANFDTYGSAYRFGYDARARYPDTAFEEMEDTLRNDWHAIGNQNTMDWTEARNAARDSHQYTDQLYRDRAKDI